MNKQIYTEYCLKNIINDKNKIKISIILILVSIIIVFLFSFHSTITTFFINGIVKDPGYRTLFVLRDENLYTEKQVINQLKKIDHVIKVFPDNEYFTILNIKNNDFQGTINLNGSSNETRPLISYGNDIKNDNEIICPEKFFPDENIRENKNIKTKDFIDMKKYINKKITASYKKIIDENNMSYQKKQFNLKVVGTYKNNPAFIDESSCYGTYNLIGKISNDIYENIDMSSQINSIMVQIDSNKYINDVINEINKNGHYVSQSLSFDDTLLNIVNKSMYLILAISFIFIISVVIYLNKKDYEISILKINILRAIGFKNKDIFKINYFEKNILGIFIFIILLFIISILYIGYKILIYFKPFVFAKIPITINMYSILIAMFIIFISLNLYAFMFNKKLTKISVIEGLKE